MAELKYVDWDGLVYYDGKIKEYIQDRDENYVKMGGIIAFAELPDPTYYNLNFIYKITEQFTSNDRFDKPGYIYKAGTWVQCVDVHDDASRYRYIIFNEETIGGTADLTNYYTKQEVDELLKDVKEGVTKDELDTVLEDYATKQDVEDVINDIKVLTEAVAEVEELLDEKANVSDLELLATKEFVLEEIGKVKPQVDLSNYYTKEETEAQITQAVSNIVVPTKVTELKNDAGYITESALEGYAKKSDIPDVSTYVTNEFLEENYVTNQTLQEQNFITENYLTENEYVTVEQVVTREEATTIIEETVNTVIDNEIESEVTKVIEQKINDGTLDVSVNSIKYGTF